MEIRIQIRSGEGSIRDLKAYANLRFQPHRGWHRMPASGVLVTPIGTFVKVKGSANE
jgi:hypothetical protein